MVIPPTKIAKVTPRGPQAPARDRTIKRVSSLGHRMSSAYVALQWAIPVLVLPIGPALLPSIFLIEHADHQLENEGPGAPATMPVGAGGHGDETRTIR